jgi:cell wall-associated NlpC family hydrolase
MLRLRLILVLFALVLAGLGATTTHAATKRHHDTTANNNNNNNNNHHHPARREAGRALRAQVPRIRYSWGGSSPRTGFDCSGLVSFVYSHFGVSLPHYTGAQLYRGRHVPAAGCARAISSSSASVTSVSTRGTGASFTRRTLARGCASSASAAGT